MADRQEFAPLNPGCSEAPFSATRPPDSRDSAPAIQGVASAVREPLAQWRRILVCLDGSSDSEGCIPHAERMAIAWGSAITLVQVLESGDPHSSTPCNVVDWELSRQEAQGYLDRAGASISRALNCDVDVRLEQGRPADRIVHVASELAACLVVIGSRGEGESSPDTLGTTALQILSMSRRSVFIAHSSPGSGTSAPKRVVVPLDGSARAESVLPIAVRLASADAAELLLVHVVQEPIPTALLSSGDDLKLAQELASRLERNARKYLERLREQLHQVPSVRVTVARHESPRQCLLEIVENRELTLLVLAAHGAGRGSSQAFGSATTYLVNHSHVPLFLVQDLQGLALDQEERAGASATKSWPCASAIHGGA
jgi:nucleotide-binding universal stress UspA family protein